MPLSSRRRSSCKQETHGTLFFSEFGGKPFKKKITDVLTYPKLIYLFSFHHVNAFEDAADNVYLDFSLYNDDTIAHQLSMSALLDRSSPSLTKPEFCRFELANVQAEAQRVENYHAATSNISPVDKLRGLMRRVSVGHGGPSYAVPEKNSNAIPPVTRIRSAPGVEMPRINPIYHGLDYKFTWGVGLREDGDGDMWDCITKLSVKGDVEPVVWSQVNTISATGVFTCPRRICAKAASLMEPFFFFVPMFIERLLSKRSYLCAPSRV